jgi:hypothetical protein
MNGFVPLAQFGRDRRKNPNDITSFTAGEPKAISSFSNFSMLVVTTEGLEIVLFSRS